MYRLEIEEESRRAHLSCYYDALHNALQALADGRAVRFWHSSYKFNLAVNNGCVRGLFRLLLHYDESREESFLTASPDVLWKLIKDFRHYVEAHCWRKDKSPYKECLELMERLYSYDRFAHEGKALLFDSGSNTLKTCAIEDVEEARYKGEIWSALSFIKSLKVRYCPYCNAETIYSIKFDGDEVVKSARSALDHYFAQSEYPFLSISLCNLVPSCTRCNTNIKRDRGMDYEEHLNPYSSSFHDAVRFICKPIDAAVALSADQGNGEEGFVFEIKRRRDCIPSLSDRGIASAKFFKIKDVYDHLFRREALSYIYKSRLIGSEYYNFVRNTLKENLSEPQIKNLFCDMVDEPYKINQVRLSKLALDMRQMVDEGRKIAKS